MFRKLLLVSTIAVLSGCASTKSSTHSTTTNQPSAFAEYDNLSLTEKNVGGNNHIKLPQSWQLKSFPMPKIGDIHPVNYRVYANDMKIAITGFEVKNGRMQNEDEFKDAVRLGSAQYFGSSKEGRSNYVSLTSQWAKGGYASFSCKTDYACFGGLIGTSSKLITVAAIRARDMVYSVTVTANTNADRDLAIAAINTIGQ